MVRRSLITTKITKFTKFAGMASVHAYSTMPFFETFVSLVVKAGVCGLGVGRTALCRCLGPEGGRRVACRSLITTKITKVTKSAAMASIHAWSAMPFFVTFVSFVVKHGA
jgi:predicted patatin/cPLA2 family phospholipase